MPIELKDYLTQTEAGEILSVNRVTIWRWMTSGKIMYVVVGGRQLIPRSEVERIDEENRKAVAEATPTA
jgi:excisionase family DNA binding protein